jgi:hypothetical protein
MDMKYGLINEEHKSGVNKNKGVKGHKYGSKKREEGGWIPPV